MTLRSVNPYTSHQVLLDLQRTNSNLATLTEQLSSGNRLTSLDVDPTASALVLNFEDSIQQNKAYIKQADSANAMLETTDTVLQSVNDAIVRLQELAVQGTGTGDNSAAEQEVLSIKENLLSLANTQTNGKYIFAGTQTQTIPFTSTATGADYGGDDGIISLDVSPSTSVATNLTGDKVFFGSGGKDSTTDLFRQVTDLANALHNNASTDTIQANLKSILSEVNANLADVGGREAALLQHQDNLDNYNTTLADIQANYQSVDYPTAYVEYAQAQLSRQASLSVLGKTSNDTLFNYLA
ncbi:MAG TPA: flagellar hook-associated protein FlgL [Holophaga sp.]|nr:flagellar hook-associated protein FlgL [Holophaga sp.]